MAGDTGDPIRFGPLSFCQELLLYTELFAGRPPTVARVVRIQGDLDLDRFKRAAAAVIAAHEPLRSSWKWDQDVPLACVWSADRLVAPTEVIAIDKASDPIGQIAAAASPAKYAAANPPLMRHALFRLDPGDYCWVFGVHHMAADAISLKLYAETFRDAYSGAVQAPIPSNAIDYARKQRAWLGSTAAQAELEWWLPRLRRIPIGRLPVRVPTTGGSGLERQEFRLPSSLRDAVVRAARHQRVPLAAMLIAAYGQAVHARDAGHEHWVFTNVPGRSLPGAASASGACYNSVPLRLSGCARSADAITETAEALFEVLDHQEVPIPLLSSGAIEQGGFALSERIPVTFNVVDHPLSEFRMPGCRLLEIDVSTLATPQWGPGAVTMLQSSQHADRMAMDWVVTLLPASVVVAVEYSAGHADRDDVAALVGEYAVALSRLCGAESGVTDGSAGIIADWMTEP